MSNDKEESLQNLTDFGKAWQEAKKEYEAENDAWWNNLSETEREDAFYAVVKRIYQADIVDNGTYRYALYDVFGFDMGMYGRGMDCGYMELHNAIYDSDELAAMKSVTRFEVIDDTGRAYVKYLKDDEGIKYSLQDDDKTLKVFIECVNLK